MLCTRLQPQGYKNGSEKVYASTLTYLIELLLIELYWRAKKMDNTSKNSNPRAKPLFGVHLSMQRKKLPRALAILCRLVGVYLQKHACTVIEK